MKAPGAVPEHLAPFVVEQDYAQYTAMDHAAWRYIMRVSRDYFKKHAHSAYLDGLEATGISIERIPRIAEMDEKLQRFGWRAVGVSGFIPPAAFMEFQSLGFLPIACEMRTLEHLAYTPAPDIVHEAAGHAPIIADLKYAKYLRAYGEVARKAIFSHHDMRVYEAIRILSEVKEDPASSQDAIDAAQDRLDEAVSQVDYVSEATYLARMNWWTVEYGLVQGPDDAMPLIYGAGLLSSVGESHSCLDSKVQKIPFTLDCINMAYDITRPQPRLFVVPHFERLTEALDAFSQTMAYRLGGVAGLAKAKTAQTVTTVVLDSGLQMSGVLADFLIDRSQEVAYLQFQGPTQLAFADRQLSKQGPEMHPHGFGTPVGAVAFQSNTRWEFENGIVAEGEVVDHIHQDGKLVIVRWKTCTVRWGDRVLYRPEWGTFDMGLGQRVTSVFGGSADRPAYLKATAKPLQTRRTQKTNLTAENRELCELYARVREVRESKGRRGPFGRTEILEMLKVLKKRFPEDWLLSLELFELSQLPEVRQALEQHAEKDPSTGDLIRAGIRLALT